MWESKEWVKIKDFSTFDNHFDQSDNESSPLKKNSLRGLEKALEDTEIKIS